MRKPLVAGNWKMHGSKQSAIQLLSGIKSAAGALSAEMAVLVPFPYLPLVDAELDTTSISFGAQDVSSHQDEGAYTGEVSSSMLLDMGCKYVIVGHSERRQYHSESSQLVADKFLAAAESELRPILCIGENLEQREAGETESILRAQLAPVLEHSAQHWQGAVIAYEPVWAIGTGLSATPAMAQAAHRFIRDLVQEKYGEKLANCLRILYGGSVKPANAAELFAMADIDGGLVGGAALAAESFTQIGALCKI